MCEYFEFSNLQPPDVFARDGFGASAALSGHTLVIGATGNFKYLNS
jgi:hypothetical protein